MRIPRVYLEADLEDRDSAQLDADEAHYLSRVLRLRPGNPVVLFDGRGVSRLGSVAHLEKKKGTVTFDEPASKQAKDPLNIVLVSALVKGERQDWLLQKATELGVSEFKPVITKHTVVKLTEERIKSRMNHWSGVVRSACEQCHRNWLPKLNKPRPFDQMLDRLQQAPGTKLICHTDGGGSRIKTLNRDQQNTVFLMVGPEGGFDPAEITHALDVGFIPISLGTRILRTETAAIASLAAIQSHWGDL